MSPSTALAALPSPQSALENALAKHFGLEQYDTLIELARKASCNISTDRQFQHTFNALYNVRRNQTWQEAFYAIFQDAHHNRELDFFTLLNKVHAKTGRVELSFVSKMIATLDPMQPIWDRRIASTLRTWLEKQSEILLPCNPTKDRLMTATHSYVCLQTFYSEFIHQEQAIAYIAAFDRILPRYSHISSVKKIDCFLWGSMSQVKNIN